MWTFTTEHGHARHTLINRTIADTALQILLTYFHFHLFQRHNIIPLYFYQSSYPHHSSKSVLIIFNIWLCFFFNSFPSKSGPQISVLSILLLLTDRYAPLFYTARKEVGYFIAIVNDCIDSIENFNLKAQQKMVGIMIDFLQIEFLP